MVLAPRETSVLRETGPGSPSPSGVELSRTSSPISGRLLLIRSTAKARLRPAGADAWVVRSSSAQSSLRLSEKTEDQRDEIRHLPY